MDIKSFIIRSLPSSPVLIFSNTICPSEFTIEPGKFSLVNPLGYFSNSTLNTAPLTAVFSSPYLYLYSLSPSLVCSFLHTIAGSLLVVPLGSV